MKKHQTLIELENLVNRLLAKQTNIAYANNKKYTFKVEWKKGEHAISNGTHSTKDYYILHSYILDKTEIISNIITLFEDFYIVEPLMSSFRLQEKALEDLLSKSLSNLTINKLREYEFKKQADSTENIAQGISIKNTEIEKPKSNLIIL